MKTKKIINTEIQDEIIEEIKNIVCDQYNAFILYNIDNDLEIQNKIMAMVPRIRENFYVHNFKAVQINEDMKRPYLAIIKKILRLKFKIITEDYRYNNTRTKKYNLITKST
jgi:hypothetical protein